MEYLMTYGWAILIIAVVLAVLFQLGVFSGGNFLPHAQAGSCQVSRTIAGASLEGQCNGMLPEFVAYFNGLNPGVVGPSMTVNFNTGGYTMCAWANVPTYLSGTYGDVLVAVYYAQSGLDIVPAQSGIGMNGYLGGSGTLIQSSTTLSYWHFYCIAYSGFGSTLVTYYIDGSYIGTSSVGAVNSYTGQLQIGNDGSTCCSLTTNPPDYESNVQFYNITLSQPEIQALYLEGIGGAPIRPQNLVGWWPLNGNANDYSGNSNNAQIYNGVIYSSSWESSYTAP